MGIQGGEHTLLLWNQTKSTTSCFCNTSILPLSPYTVMWHTFIPYATYFIQILYGLLFGYRTMILFVKMKDKTENMAL